MPSPLVSPLTDTLRDLGKPRINREPSPALAIATPWLLVMLGSYLPNTPIIAAGPLVPPIGFLLLVAWLQLRPGLFPVWAGLPLGFFDDLFSGQPLGSAMLLWSATAIGLAVLEMRVPWRGVVINWLVASGVVTAYSILTAQIAAAAGGTPALFMLIPQILLSIMAYPLLAKLVGAADRFRLFQVRAV